MKFLKLEDLKLNAGGYLVSADDKPVYHEGFVNAQKEAHLLVSIANECEGKVFKSGPVSSFTDIVAKVKAKVSSEEVYEYVSAPLKEESILDQITAAGVAFSEHTDEVEKVKKTNNLMVPFEDIRKVEKAGMYFTEGVCELKKLYSVDDLVKAAKILVNID